MVGTDVGFFFAFHAYMHPRVTTLVYGFFFFANKNGERGEKEKEMESYNGERMMVRSPLGVPGEERCIRAS
jgi:hypothetical protein